MRTEACAPCNSVGAAVWFIGNVHGVIAMCQFADAAWVNFANLPTLPRLSELGWLLCNEPLERLGFVPLPSMRVNLGTRYNFTFFFIKHRIIFIFITRDFHCQTTG